MPVSLAQALPERIRKRFPMDDAVKTYRMMFTTFTRSPTPPCSARFGRGPAPRFVTLTALCSATIAAHFHAVIPDCRLFGGRCRNVPGPTGRIF